MSQCMGRSTVYEGIPQCYWHRCLEPSLFDIGLFLVLYDGDCRAYAQGSGRLATIMGHHMAAQAHSTVCCAELPKPGQLLITRDSHTPPALIASHQVALLCAL